MSFKDKTLLILTNSYPNRDNSHYGGIFVKEQINYLKDYFKEVYVISPQPVGVNRNLRDYEYKNVKVFFPRFFHLPIEYFRKRLGDNFFKAALRVIKREGLEFDLIHAHFTWPSGYAGVKLAEKFDISVVVTAHGNDIRIPLTNYLQSFDNVFLREKLDYVIESVDLLLTHHEELFDLIIKSYPKHKSKIRFLYKGISLEKFNPFSSILKLKTKEIRTSLGLGDKFVVLFLARIDWDKDPLTFVETSKILRDQKDVAFIMVGDGKLRKECLKLKEKYQLDNLHIIGKRSDTEIWYALADVFVALSPVENIWSTTLQEAFCMGLPSIATNVGYTSKILKHAKDVFLIPPKNPQALANAILKLKTDSSLREQLSRNALKWREIFDNKHIAKEIVGIYKQLSLR